MIQLEAYKPFCSICRLPESRPKPCAFRDYITEHQFPCGGAIRLLQLELARQVLLTKSDDYMSLAQSRLIREGYDSKTIEKYQTSNLYTEWMERQGESEAIERFGGAFSPSHSSSEIHGYMRLEDQFIGILYIRVQLPTLNTATAIPVLFDTNDDEYESWIQFLSDEFDQENLVVGSFDNWNHDWLRWWEEKLVDQETWTSNNSDKLSQDVIDYLRYLLLKKYQDWRQK